MQLFKTTHIDFLGKRKMFYLVSAIITIAGIIGAFVKGVEFGIDFEGGTEAAFAFQRPIEIDSLRNAVEAGGFKGPEVESYGEAGQYLVRIRNEANAISGVPRSPTNRAA